MTGHEERFLLATVRKETYALPLKDIAEVMESFQTFPLPKSPPGYLGLMNFHGSPRPVLDLSTFLHGDLPQMTGAVLVLDHHIGSLALRVDAVKRIAVDIRAAETAGDEDSRTGITFPSSDGTIRILSPERLVARLEEELINTGGAVRTRGPGNASPAA